ncbi:MAG TPA: response regulator, partial [Candidatus Paceibacterota bacterium]|nr:response regulator [Candidatus Paceibacterota bacterium]
MTAAANRIRVALVEDDPPVRAGLRHLIDNSPSCVCVGAFGTGEEALAKIPGLDLDTVLMDIQLPGVSGI